MEKRVKPGSENVPGPQDLVEALLVDPLDRIEREGSDGPPLGGQSLAGIEWRANPDLPSCFRGRVISLSALPAASLDEQIMELLEFVTRRKEEEIKEPGGRSQRGGCQEDGNPDGQ